MRGEESNPFRHRRGLSCAKEQKMKKLHTFTQFDHFIPALESEALSQGSRHLQF